VPLGAVLTLIGLLALLTWLLIAFRWDLVAPLLARLQVSVSNLLQARHAPRAS
jgi:hypothetical protein